jgi:hypothetical protein
MPAAKLGAKRRPAASSKQAKGRAINPKARPARKRADSGEPRAGSTTPELKTPPGRSPDPATEPRAFPDAVFDDAGGGETNDIERGSARRSR